MYIKYIIFCLLLVVSGKRLNDDNMTWNASRKLTWADFKARPNINSHAVALTASGITFGYAVKTSGERIIDFTTSVEAHFYPNKSWYLKDRRNTYILAHEQLHFDITELYARMFRAQLKGLVVTQNVKDQMQRLHKAINEAVDETQKRYDAQSNHSMNAKVQKQWEAIIDKELKALAHYKSQ
jgi:hypothetical protein